MPPSDYEIYRQRLEEQLRADVELLYEAYRAKLRAYETVLRTRAEIGAGPWPPAELTLSLPAAPGPQATPPPADAPAPPPKPSRSRAYRVLDAVEDALEKMEEVFDRHDLVREIGFEPKRATLLRVLDELKKAGVLAVAEEAVGKQPTRYRKVAPAAPPAG